MRPIEFEIDKLVGYSVVGSGELRIKKLGSPKFDVKKITREELDAQAVRMNAAA